MKFDNYSKQIVMSHDSVRMVDIKFILEAHDYIPWSKISLFRQLFSNKRVLNLECGDHSIDRFEKKYRENEWVHEHLSDVSALLTSVDKNKEIVSHINSIIRDPIYCLDAIHDVHPILEINYDILLISDALDHKRDPVGYLSAIHNKFQKTVDQIFVSVPNANSLNSIKYARKVRENINAGHNFIFTPFTLARCLTLAGFDCESFYMMDNISDQRSYPIKRILLRTLPGQILWRNSILNQNRIGLMARFS